MTESKQDIQAQIDQLDADWTARCKAFEVGGWFRKELPKEKVSSYQELWHFVVIPLLAVGLIGVLALQFWSTDKDLLSWFKKEWMICLVPLALGINWFTFSRYIKKADVYFQEKKAYFFRREELQENLDALD